MRQFAPDTSHKDGLDVKPAELSHVQLLAHTTLGRVVHLRHLGTFRKGPRVISAMNKDRIPGLAENAPKQ